MKIEVGKRYRTRGGGQVRITQEDNDSRWPFRGEGTNGSGRVIAHDPSWTRDGHFSCDYPDFGTEDVLDLVAEIDEAGETVTFDEAPPTGVVEVGGCAPPVMVDGPVATVYDAMGERVPERAEPVEIKPVVHDEPLQVMADGSLAPVFPPAVDAEFVPPAEPVSLRIPLAEAEPRELQLMAALDRVMYAFGPYGYPGQAEDDERRRAVDWLHAKYGTRP